MRGEKQRTLHSTCRYQCNSARCHMDGPGIDPGLRGKILANKEGDRHKQGPFSYFSHWLKLDNFVTFCTALF
jgi:hypothetical protein